MYSYANIVNARYGYEYNMVRAEYNCFVSIETNQSEDDEAAGTSANISQSQFHCVFLTT